METRIRTTPRIVERAWEPRLRDVEGLFKEFGVSSFDELKAVLSTRHKRRRALGIEQILATLKQAGQRLQKKELAAMIGCTPPTMSRILKGQRSLAPHMEELMTWVLGIEPHEIYLRGEAALHREDLELSRRRVARLMSEKSREAIKEVVADLSADDRAALVAELGSRDATEDTGG